MIRVMNVISDTNIGGAGRVILNYLCYADKDRFETWAALPRGSLLKAPLEKAGAKTLEVEGIADLSYHREGVERLRAVMKELKPDIVHTHGCLSGRIAARREKIPAVYSRHSAFPVPARLRYPPGRWVNKFVNEHYADRIIAVSPAARDNLVQGGVSPNKITVVMNGTAPVPRISEEERAALREELSIPPEKIQLLGRLDFIAHRANFLMQPVLGVVDSGALARMVPSPAEVDGVFFVPLSHLLETAPIECEYELIPTPAENFPYEVIGIPRNYKWQHGWENVPVYPWQGRAIWGLTGRITRNLVRICKTPG